MFRHLSRRIVMISFATVALCTILIGVFSYQWAKRTVQSEFINVSSGYFLKSNELIVQYMNSIEETARVMLDNPVIAREIRQPNVSMEVQPLLDSFSVGLDVEPLGISVYKTDGTVYTLSRMSNIPSFERLAGDERIKRFLNDASLRSTWMFRDRELPFFNVNSYSAGGTLTYLLKASDENGRTPGILVVDLDVSRLFAFFTTDNHLFRQSTLLLLRDNEDRVYASADAGRRIPDADDLNAIKKDPEGSFLSSGGERLIQFKSVLSANSKLVMVTPLNSPNAYLHSLGNSILLLTLLFGLLAVLLAWRLRTSIIRPLTQLYERIKGFD